METNNPFLQQIEMIDALLSDIKEAEAELDTGNVQFRRRTFIRTFFALVEAAIFVQKQTALKAHECGKIQFSLGELAMLQEKQFDLAHGEVTARTKFLKPADNMRFSFRALAKAIGSQYVLDVGDARWDKFLGAIKIRNRITHPKLTSELLISDVEIKDVLDVSTWFRQVGWELFKSRS